MKKITFFKALCLLLPAVFVVVSCKNSSNNPTETYTFESTVTPTNAGTINPSQGSFDSGEQVQILATPNENWVFKNWNGDYSGTNNPATVTINKNMSINALFEELTFPLTVIIEGEGQISEEIVNAKTDYKGGTTVQLTAVPAEHWEFKEWQGALDGSNNPAMIMMDQEKTVTAIFEETLYPLTVLIEGEGEVSEDIVMAKTDYTHGTMVELSATPANYWHFVEWTGDLNSVDNPALITIDKEKNVNAIFDFGFNENFEDETAKNWNFSDNRFSVKNGKLQLSTGKDGSWGSAYYNKKFKDFKVEARVTRQKSKETIDYALTLFIRSSGFLEEKKGSNGYEISITQSGFGSIWKLEDGKESSIVPWVPVEELKKGLGKYNVVTVNVIDSKFDIYINGEHVIGFSDDTFMEGFVGIAAYASSKGNNLVEWDYVKVSPADEPMNVQGKLRIDIADQTEGSSSTGHLNID